MTIKAADIPFTKNTTAIHERIFEPLGEQRYAIHYLPAGVHFEVDRLRRERHELVGELLVRVNGNFPDSKSTDGVMSVGDFNFSSVQARTTRSKLLADRAGNTSVDWFGLLEEFCVKVIRSERQGAPAITLAEAEEPDEQTEAWMVGDFPILQQLPMVIFGDSGNGKSYFAMWIAGQLANMVAAEGRTVIYADWELAIGEHRKRLGRLFTPMPLGVKYVRCERSLRHEIDRIKRLAVAHKAAYVICDSIGFALDGAAESQEAASDYFRALRQLPVGSLNIAHIPKQYDDGREATIFGSAFFKHGGRSIWFIERAKQMLRRNELAFGLYHRKTNVGELLKPKGYKFIFAGQRAIVESIGVDTIDELAAAMPLVDRLKIALRGGYKTIKDVAEELAVPQDTVRKTTARHTSLFLREGVRIALKAEYDDEPQQRKVFTEEF